MSLDALKNYLDDHVEFESIKGTFGTSLFDVTPDWDKIQNEWTIMRVTSGIGASDGKNIGALYSGLARTVREFGGTTFGYQSSRYFFVPKEKERNAQNALEKILQEFRAYRFEPSCSLNHEAGANVIVMRHLIIEAVRRYLKDVFRDREIVPVENSPEYAMFLVEEKGGHLVFCEIRADHVRAPCIALDEKIPNGVVFGAHAVSFVPVEKMNPQKLARATQFIEISEGKPYAYIVSQADVAGLSEEIKGKYVRGRLGNSRARLDALGKSDNAAKSRGFLLQVFVDGLLRKYCKEYLKKFEQVCLSESGRVGRSNDRKDKKTLGFYKKGREKLFSFEKYWEDKSIHLIDLRIRNPKDMVLETIKSEIQEILDIQFKDESAPLHIIVCDDPDSEEIINAGEDPYKEWKKKHKDAAVQAIVQTDLIKTEKDGKKDNNKTIVSVILKELFIKEIVQKRMGKIVSWPNFDHEMMNLFFPLMNVPFVALLLQGDMRIGKNGTKEKIVRRCGMRTFGDGNFVILPLDDMKRENGGAFSLNAGESVFLISFEEFSGDYDTEAIEEEIEGIMSTTEDDISSRNGMYAIVSTSNINYLGNLGAYVKNSKNWRGNIGEASLLFSGYTQRGKIGKANFLFAGRTDAGVQEKLDAFPRLVVVDTPHDECYKDECYKAIVVMTNTNIVRWGAPLAMPWPVKFMQEALALKELGF